MLLESIKNEFENKTQLLFVAGWAFLAFILLVLTLTGAGVWWHRGWAISVVSLELWAAIRSSDGIPLSAIMQKIAAAGEGRSKWYQGWKALATGITVIFAAEIGWVTAYWKEPFDRPVFGIVWALVIFGWNLYHWLNTKKHG